MTKNGPCGGCVTETLGPCNCGDRAHRRSDVLAVPTRCGKCGFVYERIWKAEEGLELEACPQCGYKPKVAGGYSVGETFVTTGDQARPDPAEEIRRARELLRPKPEGLKLTVGDLSVVAEEKRKREDTRQRNRSDERGLTVGDLHEGPAAPEPSTSPSQDILLKMQRRHREQQEETRRIRGMMAAGEKT